MPFKKGQSGNPLGSLPIGNDLKEARKLTRLEFERIVNKYLFMTMRDIRKSMEDQTAKECTPMLDLIVISILQKALIEGDEKRFNFLLDRTIGQVVRRIHVAPEVEEDQRPPVEMSAEEKLQMLERYKEIILSKKDREVVDVSPVDREDEPQVSEADK